MRLDGALVPGLLGEMDLVLRPAFEIILVFVRHFTRVHSTHYTVRITRSADAAFREFRLTWIAR